ncbi:hypothetical protein JK358_07420 [Nocardia sp. 2]|uniref:Uncharacterized protein n=1 Tax=Nocardia acididurans TaxID=2802282 RepID=A0ABS1M0M0_9NOCA|nr:hypothetical protein [Nocardia acididurans]MBL1074223.1 hypothetical protein [Nocardia acididurans]
MNTNQPEPGRTAHDDDPLVPIPIPALIALLIRREDDKGAALTEDEVLDVRNKALCMMMPLSDQRALARSRGYRDIDPDYVWQEWCVYKSGQDPFTLAEDLTDDGRSNSGSAEL